MASRKRLTAKYPSQCPKCQKAILVGASVYWTPGEKAYHVTCPAGVDMEFEISGDALRSRLAEARAKYAVLAALENDWREEKAGREPDVCPHCHTARNPTVGLVSTELNYSDTMDVSDWRVDVSDWRDVVHTCGTSLNVEWDAEARWPKFPTRQTEPNPECVAKYEAWKAWAQRDERARLLSFPGRELLTGMWKLVAWCENELRVRSGDVATVINRNKPYTGRVVWVGDDAFGTDRRCKVITDKYVTHEANGVAAGAVDRRTVGGSVATATLQSRVVRVNASVLPPSGERATPVKDWPWEKQSLVQEMAQEQEAAHA